MKMIFALLIGCLPLGLLTVGSFLPASQNPKAAPPPKLDDNALRTSAEQQGADAGKAAVYLQKLEKVDLFSARELQPEVSLSESLTPAGKKWFGPVQQSWSSAQTAHDGVVGFVALYHPKPISEKRKLLAELEKFASRTNAHNPIAGVRGDVGFADYVGTLCDQIGPQIAADEQFSKAQTLFTQKNHAGCLTELQLINRATIDPKQLANVVELQRQAEFWKHWQSDSADTNASPAAIERRKSLLQSSPQPVLADEKAKVELVERAFVKSDCEHERDQLRDRPPAQARDYLRRVAALVQNKACPDFRPMLRTQFSKWLTTKLPLADAGITATSVGEAEKKSGLPIAGVFQKADDKTSVWYKYWKTAAEFKQFGESKYDQIYLQQLKDVEPPKKPLCLRCAGAFNEGRRKLLANWQSESEWREFATLCQRLQREWKQYQDLKGLAEFERAAETKIRDLEFEAALALANEVLGEWSAVATLIGE